MVKKKLPKNWNRSEKSIRAIQLAFEFSGDIPHIIRDEASKLGLSPSDQIRKIVGLEVTPPKRPRLTISLNQKDYQSLAARYCLSSDDKEGIRKAIRDDLIEFAEKSQNE